jgi:hypothetical protein
MCHQSALGGWARHRPVTRSPRRAAAHPDWGTAAGNEKGSDPNGMKLAAQCWLDQLLTQFVPRFDHDGEGLGAALLDARLQAMRSDGVDTQGSSWHPRARRAEPPEGIEKTDPLHNEVLKDGRLAHDPPDQVVDESQDSQGLQHACDCLTVHHLHRHRGLEVCQRGFDMLASTVQLGEVSHTIDWRIEPFGDQRHVAGPEPRHVEVVAHLGEHEGLWQGGSCLPSEP